MIISTHPQISLNCSMQSQFYTASSKSMPVNKENWENSMKKSNKSLSGKLLQHLNTGNSHGINSARYAEPMVKCFAAITAPKYTIWYVSTSQKFPLQNINANLASSKLRQETSSKIFQIQRKISKSDFKIRKNLISITSWVIVTFYAILIKLI